jgi:hypothetical protein
MCGKQTRETGASESLVELCRKCFRETEWENHHGDCHDPSTPKEQCAICAGEGFPEL